MICCVAGTASVLLNGVRVTWIVHRRFASRAWARCYAVQLRDLSDACSLAVSPCADTGPLREGT